jgi:S-formylglutathione hydrolase FrmB
MQRTSFQVTSNVLAGNPMGDKNEKPITIFSPDKQKQNSPLIIALPSFANDPDSFLSSSPLSESFSSIVNRLYQKDALNGANIAIIDSFTKLGGNYYLNSPAVGQYESFIVKEVVPELRKKLSPSLIGLIGKGSGGFGAYSLAVRNPGVFSGFAAHSMDAGFENVFLPDFSLTMENFRNSAGPSKWLQKYWSGFNRVNSNKIKVLRILCASAFFSPDNESKEMRVVFPFNWESGEFRQDIWNRWLSYDPARNVAQMSRQLESMKGIFIDAGTMDDFSAIWGARTIDTKMTEAKINHTYEEYEDGHFGINYRFEKSLPFLAQALS